jgi:glycosyltransferase involved in cell wall biosynthesis
MDGNISPNKTVVSLIVPTLRRPDFLLRCLSSVALQTERPTEVLVGIRANDDLSRPILRMFSDMLDAELVQALGAIGFQINLHRFDGKSHYGLVHAKNTRSSGTT